MGDLLLDAPASDQVASAGRRRRFGRRTRLVLGAALLVPVVSVAAGYAVFFTPDSPGELRLSTSAGDAGEAVRAGVWSVGPGSVAATG